jgi:hypothetical protein
VAGPSRIRFSILLVAYLSFIPSFSKRTTRALIAIRVFLRLTAMDFVAVSLLAASPEIEETPAPGLSANMRPRLLRAAVRLGEAMSYQSAGTVDLFTMMGQARSASWKSTRGCK